ncbi:MAG: NADH:ubiquinone reductase (Na(+)-transporting) subunit B [Salinivirgaceae bacterium]|jgi:Na+-transporting NADH:ubiquinone oxidoreductase subunit B|nr:NADH:ubiquinone reductase (Na(+)-transporting) subunit B [Salinivirgaceae bacterium]
MKFIRKQLDKMKPSFEKGGKLSSFHSMFDAIETLFFVPKKTAQSGIHVHDSKDSKRLMIIVVLAMVPALLFGMWNTGYQHFLSINETADFWTMFWYGFLKVLPIIIVSYGVGLGLEIVFAQLRGHDVKEGFFVSGMLIPLIVPVNAPLWMVAVATAFAVVIGVEAFGGAGMNILNPALTARAFLFFAYPSHMSGDAVWIAEKADAFSGATPLAEAAAGNSLPSALDMFYGFIPGSIGETSTLAILIGAAILIYTGVGSWKIMLSVALGGLAMGYIFNAFAANQFMEIPAHYHLLMGGFAFGAIFMATDPVSAAQTNKGKWIYGFLIGFIAVLIRVLNPAYPEGMMLAILLLNVFAPLIDHYVVQGNIKRRLKRVKVKA